MARGVKKAAVTAVKEEPKAVVPVSGGARSKLPELLDTDYEEKGDTVLLLERAYNIKQAIGTAPTDKKHGTGLLGELHDCKEQLHVAQVMAGLEGLRHNRIVFVSALRKGRETTPIKDLSLELLNRGVSASVIGDAIKAATKTGEEYFVRELEEL